MLDDLNGPGPTSCLRHVRLATAIAVHNRYWARSGRVLTHRHERKDPR